MLQANVVAVATAGRSLRPRTVGAASAVQEAGLMRLRSPASPRDARGGAAADNGRGRSAGKRRKPDSDDSTESDDAEAGAGAGGIDEGVLGIIDRMKVQLDAIVRVPQSTPSGSF